MFSREFRAAAALALAASMLSGLAIAHAQAPRLWRRPLRRPALLRRPLSSTASAQPTGGLLHSSLRDPDGSATDQWTWDDFVLGSAQTISEVRWRRLRPGQAGLRRSVWISRGHLSSNAAAAYRISPPPLAHYELGSNAARRRRGVGGVQTYDYGFVLPTPFKRLPDEVWSRSRRGSQARPTGLAKATGGNGHHFEKVKTTVASSIGWLPRRGLHVLAPGVATQRLYLPLLLRSAGG